MFFFWIRATAEEQYKLIMEKFRFPRGERCNLRHIYFFHINILSVCKPKATFYQYYCTIVNIFLDFTINTECIVSHFPPKSSSNTEKQKKIILLSKNATHYCRSKFKDCTTAPRRPPINDKCFRNIKKTNAKQSNSRRQSFLIKIFENI